MNKRKKILRASQRFETKILVKSVLIGLCLGLFLINGCSKEDDTSSTPKRSDNAEITAHFKFDDNIIDSANPKNIATENKTSYVESFDGSKALMIPAEDDAMLTINGGMIDKREMTISFWAKDLNVFTSTSRDLYDRHIFHAVNYNYGKTSFLFSVNRHLKRLRYVCTQYHIYYDLSVSYLFSHAELSGWHMYTLVHDFNITAKSRATTLLYVDGVFIDDIKEDINRFSEAEGTDDARNYNHCSKFIIGGNLQLSKTKAFIPTTIIIDNLRIYQNARLSDKAIKKIYDTEKR